MATADRAARDRKAFAGRLKTAAHAGLRNSQRSAEGWWNRLHEERLTAHNVCMEGFFEHITGYQFQAELWGDLIKALDASTDPVATWHEKIAEAERVAAHAGGSMGNPVADARQHVRREAHGNFARYAADYFRRVS
ncbi:hypothetical protein ACFY4B_27425 [Kitasatospora sp. NPDC001261]|uniref:hypothetical protein n=1 Tax=Kitasatospora sp. NPDC001261 TaxID=3364012 RepID=UPI00368644BE